MTITKTRVNKVYRAYKLLYATYHGDIWTTNTYIAERGKIEPRVYKDTVDYRDRQDKPKLDSIIDNPIDVEPVLQVNKYDETVTRVETKSYSYDYNATYVNYLVDKYGQESLLLEPQGRTSKLYAQDDDGNTVAVLMGLTE